LDGKHSSEEKKESIVTRVTSFFLGSARRPALADDLVTVRRHDSTETRDAAALRRQNDAAVKRAKKRFRAFVKLLIERHPGGAAGLERATGIDRNSIANKWATGKALPMSEKLVILREHLGEMMGSIDSSLGFSEEPSDSRRKLSEQELAVALAEHVYRTCTGRVSTATTLGKLAKALGLRFQHRKLGWAVVRGPHGELIPDYAGAIAFLQRVTEQVIEEATAPVHNTAAGSPTSQQSKEPTKLESDAPFVTANDRELAAVAGDRRLGPDELAEAIARETQAAAEIADRPASVRARAKQAAVDEKKRLVEACKREVKELHRTAVRRIEDAKAAAAIALSKEEKALRVRGLRRSGTGSVDEHDTQPSDAAVREAADTQFFDAKRRLETAESELSTLLAGRPRRHLYNDYGVVDGTIVRLAPDPTPNEISAVEHPSRSPSS